MVALLYSNQRSNDALLQQNKEAQAEEISLICSSIQEAMSVAENVADRLSEDEKVREITSKVLKKDYKDAETFEEDCKALSFIDRYEQYYQEEISSIKIYVRNETIVSNQYFSYMNNNMQKQDIDFPEYYKNGDVFWSYTYDNNTSGKKIMQMTRQLRDEQGAEIGVLAIRLQPKRTMDKVHNRNDNTVLIYADRDILTTSFSIGEEYDFLFKELERFKADKGTTTLTYGIKEYLVTYERIISARRAENYYTVVDILDYQELRSKVNQTIFVSISIGITGLFISIILILFFSIKIGKRMNRLRLQMHLVATGKYEELEPIEGSDEVAQLYQDLERMAEDIQRMTDSIVEEKVQKERLHTRQKEVEFKMLTSQINPHFLYNTLETIRMKAKINREPEIEELVKRLAKVMRRNIQVGDQMVTLGSEIELLENYFVIQDYRFGDRIHTEIIVEKNVNTDILVIPLIMQPFAENAFVHGLESKESDGKLSVHISRMADDINIEITDNGIGMNYYKLAKIRRNLREDKNLEKEHIGISNVHQRLILLYGEEYGVSIESREGRGTSVTIRFPAETKFSYV